MKLPKRYNYPSPGFASYWTEPTGLRLLQKLGYTPDEESVRQYAALYWEGDEAVDPLISEFFSGQQHKQAHQWLNEILLKGVSNVKDIPEALRNFFEGLEQVPNWVDFNLLNKGARFVQRTGISSANILRNYSLMGGYESAAINKPLVYTGALKKGAAKRMMETYDFWVNVTGTDAMRVGRPGFKSAGKVRFIHALVRHYVQKMKEWDNNKWGIPLNQGDMVATHLGFTLVYLEGLRKVGFSPTGKEIDGLFHLWKYIGHVMGIPKDYLPDEETQAIAGLYKWTMAQPGADEDTKALAEALVDEPLHAHQPKEWWAKKLQLEAHLAFNEYLLGEHSCQRIGIRKSKLPGIVPELFKAVNLAKEPLIHRNKYLYYESAAAGRADQDKLRSIFLKAHPTVWT
jgi:hypothetical protein